MRFMPHVTVASIVERDGKFLMVHENAESRGVYNQPAGHLEANETFAEAAIRETLEETGWTVEPQAVVGVNLYKAASNGITYVRVTFIAKAISHDASRALDDGIIEAVWLSYEELLGIKEKLRSSLTLNIIDDYRAGKRFDLSLLDHLSTE